MTKEILWAGSSKFYEHIKMDAFAESLPNLQVHFSRNLISALDTLNAKSFSGVYIGDLWLPLCDIEQLSRKEEVFAKRSLLESSEKYGNGIYLARYSVEKGIPVLVSTSENRERTAARQVGATICFGEDLKGLERKFREVFKL